MQRVTVTLDDELIVELERYMKGRVITTGRRLFVTLLAPACNKHAANRAAPAIASRPSSMCTIIPCGSSRIVLPRRITSSRSVGRRHAGSSRPFQLHGSRAAARRSERSSSFRRTCHRRAGVRHGRLVAVPVEVKEETHPTAMTVQRNIPTSTSGTPDDGERTGTFLSSTNAENRRPECQNRETCAARQSGWEGGDTRYVEKRPRR